MPELPEVETTRRGIATALTGRTITGVVVRDRRLRWPVPRDLARKLVGYSVQAVERRGKYLLLRIGEGWLILHLGMSGNLRVLDPGEPRRKHDHVEFQFAGQALRLHDPRRFGAVLWHEGEPAAHALLRGLGPEPLSDDFNGDTLWRATRARRVAVKPLLMNAAIVVGVGNIYASEALFRAGIRPGTRADRLSRERCARLAGAVKATLTEAVAAGGTTLRDYVSSAGEPGHFRLRCFVYGRAGEPCRVCGTAVRGTRTGQRSTFFCPVCQR